MKIKKANNSNQERIDFIEELLELIFFFGAGLRITVLTGEEKKGYFNIDPKARFKISFSKKIHLLARLSDEMVKRSSTMEEWKVIGITMIYDENIIFRAEECTMICGRDSVMLNSYDFHISEIDAKTIMLLKLNGIWDKIRRGDIKYCD
jgi:hypothetical protein